MLSCLSRPADSAAGYMEKFDARDGAESIEERVLALHTEEARGVVVVHGMVRSSVRDGLRSRGGWRSGCWDIPARSNCVWHRCYAIVELGIGNHFHLWEVALTISSRSLVGAQTQVKVSVRSCARIALNLATDNGSLSRGCQRKVVRGEPNSPWSWPARVEISAVW